MEGNGMAKEAGNQVRNFFLCAWSHIKIYFIKVLDCLILAFSTIDGRYHRLAKWIKESRDHYTVLIVPQKKSTVRKISASSTFVGLTTVSVVLVTFCGLYLVYHFFAVQRVDSELAALKRLSQTQKEQISLLVSKVGDFEKKMKNLREYDYKIRSMANIARKPDGQFRGVGGPSPDSITQGYATSLETATIHRMNRDMDQLIQEAAQRENSFKEIIEYLEKSKSILASTPSIWPVNGWVTSWFGKRTCPFSGQYEFHSAVDIAARSGKEVIATADGIVSDADRRADYGNFIAIDHGHGMTTLYAHLLKGVVGKGKIVKRGEIIGYIGSTGRSTGPHLHYCIYLNGVPVNPRNYLQ
jgi:murein DD-endopeptidase MepM/ murein hydrolase activator NlpD